MRRLKKNEPQFFVPVEKEQSEDPAGSGLLPRRLNAKNELQFFVSPRKAKHSGATEHRSYHIAGGNPVKKELAIHL